MLLLRPENARWRHWSYGIFILLIGSYIWLVAPEHSYGGTSMGLVYGTAGLVMILFLMSYGVRKRSYQSSLGTVEAWLHSHIYIGLITMLTILLHSGFRFHDRVAVAALIFLSLVALSGLFGAILYTLVPPMLTSVDSNFTATEMSDQINQVSQSMARLASGKSDEFQEIHAGLLQAERPGPMAGWRVLFRRYLSKRLENRISDSFQRYSGRVQSEEQADLTQLLVLAHQRKELHDRLIYKQRHINIMGAWLYVHVPLAIVTMATIAAHIAAFFYYG